MTEKINKPAIAVAAVFGAAAGVFLIDISSGGFFSAPEPEAAPVKSIYQAQAESVAAEPAVSSREQQRQRAWRQFAQRMVALSKAQDSFTLGDVVSAARLAGLPGYGEMNRSDYFELVDAISDKPMSLGELEYLASGFGLGAPAQRSEGLRMSLGEFEKLRRATGQLPPSGLGIGETDPMALTMRATRVQSPGSAPPLPAYGSASSGRFGAPGPWEDTDTAYSRMQRRQADAGPSYSSPITGTQYKYDLSKDADRNRYMMDQGAQIRDSMNPWVDTDRAGGYYGGGGQ